MSIGWGLESFAIWEGVPTVAAGSEYLYCDPSLDMSGTSTDYYWGDAEGDPVSYGIAPGQGIGVNGASDLDVTMAGQVPTGSTSFTTVQDNNFTGNPYPASIDIQSIKIDDACAMSIGW